MLPFLQFLISANFWYHGRKDRQKYKISLSEIHKCPITTNEVPCEVGCTKHRPYQLENEGPGFHVECESFLKTHVANLEVK